MADTTAWTPECPERYTTQQIEWCQRYSRETTFDPLMCDFEAGNESFVEAARKSLHWFESWASDALLRADDGPIPGADDDFEESADD